MSKFYPEKGFTVLELLTVLTIVSIIFAIALPKVSEIREVMNKNAAENQVMQHLRFIQVKSVEQGCRGNLVISSNKQSYSLGCDYIPFNETVSTTYDTLLKTYNLPTGITLEADDKIIFNTRGQAVDYMGSLDTKTVTLKNNGAIFKTGSISATGFFDYN